MIFRDISIFREYYSGMKLPFPITSLFLTILTIVCFGSLALPRVAVGQGSEPKSANDLRPPTAEKFVPVDFVLANSSSIPCTAKPRNLNLACFKQDGARYKVSSRVRLYEADATIWKWFETSLQKPDYFLRDPSKDFLPFATNAVGGADEVPNGIMLRLVGESDSWYEVEINETTRETKYALRNDPDWRKTEYEAWLPMSFNLRLSKDHPPLLDTPNGKVIPESAEIKFETVRFIKADGDWAYVSGAAKPGTFAPDIRRGWIRWRKGRQILIGCIFNRYIAP